MIEDNAPTDYQLDSLDLHQPRTQVDINGELLDYDLADKNPDCSLGKGITYLGSSQVVYYDGVRNEEKGPYHYWSRS